MKQTEIDNRGTKRRNKLAKDPLMGAPGHLSSPDLGSQTESEIDESNMEDVADSKSTNFKIPSLDVVKNHPMAAAGAVAVGVGTMLLIKTFLKGNKSSAESKKAGFSVLGTPLVSAQSPGKRKSRAKAKTKPKSQSKSKKKSATKKKRQS